MSERDVDLALGVLDHQLVDSEGRRCGKVDDLELEGLDEARPRVAAIVSGPPAWRRRGPFGRLATRLSRGRETQVAWDAVREVASGVHLSTTAKELGLGRGDDRARRLVERIPRSGLSG
jgi:hypothetical protein